MRIGVIADTHGRFDPALVEYFAGVSAILHAGDIGDPSVIRKLETIAPVIAVSGNVDEFERSGYPRLRVIRRAGVTIALRHILFERGCLSDEAREWLERTRPDVCVFGHSHRPTVDRYAGTILFNPGSAGPRRFALPRGVGLLVVRNGHVTPSVIRLPDSIASPRKKNQPIIGKERSVEMSKHGWKRSIASAVLASVMLTSTACYGPFNLTRNVYHWNSGIKGSGEVNDKWMKEFVFFGMIVVPVYMFSALLDAFIFNSIQFWSGDNPVKVSHDDQGRIREVQLGKVIATVTWAEDGRSARVEYVRDGRIVNAATISEVDGRLALHEQSGRVVTAEVEPVLGLRYRSANGQIVDQLSEEQIQWGMERLQRAAS